MTKRSTRPSAHRFRPRLAHLRGVVVLLALIPFALLTSCGSSAGDLGGLSAEQVISVSVKAAQAAGPFHFVDKYGSGTGARLIVGDTGTVAAQQTLDGPGASPLEIRLVGGVAYVLAPSAATLESALGLSATEASTVAGKWVSLTSHDTKYKRVVQTLKPAVEFDTYIPDTHLVLGAPTTIHGVGVIPVSGSASASLTTGALNAEATLFVSTQAPNLPVAGALSGTDVHGRTQHEDVIFTDWGEHVKVVVPTGVVPATSLGG